MLCEIEPGAQAVLGAHFPGIPLWSDVRKLKSIPRVDVVAAGFPCQDLSQAGRKSGIGGLQSGLVGEVFRLLRPMKSRPRWLVLENVKYMLHLGNGEAMRLLTSNLERLGYAWAYRLVDSRAFGVPQRRQRVLFVASRTEDPRRVLFADEYGPPESLDDRLSIDRNIAYGFYWTEGLRGLGWAVDGVPTIKGGSRLGIPSPPAVWVPRFGFVGTPDLRDSERLQGFSADWTKPAELGVLRNRRLRWALVGNAVCVPMAGWLGSRLGNPGEVVVEERSWASGDRWPRAAWGRSGKVYGMDASEWPIRAFRPHLLDFMRFSMAPLSARATSGFLSRARKSRIRFVPGFLESLASHLRVVQSGLCA